MPGGCGINFIQTMGQIKTLIWRTLNAGILSTVNYRVYIFRIETSSSNAQVFTLSDGGSVQVFELMKDINVFLTAEGRQSWGNPILAGDYDSIYYVQPEHSLPRWDTVVLTLDGEDDLYYGFADIKTAYEAKHGALGTGAPKVFFKYFLVNSSTGETSVPMQALATYAVAAAPEPDPENP